MHSFARLREIYDVVAKSDNKTPDGYLLDSVGSLFNMRGTGPNRDQRDIKECINELDRLGVIVCYTYTVRATAAGEKPTTTRIIKILIKDFTWQKFLQLTNSDVEVLHRDDLKRLLDERV